MRDSYEKFRQRGVEIVALSVDPPETTRMHAEKQEYPFIFLADEKMEVVRRYDFFHENGSFKIPGGDISRPAEFLIDPAGTIRWRNLTGSYRERLKAEEALKIIDEVRAADK